MKPLSPASSPSASNAPPDPCDHAGQRQAHKAHSQVVTDPPAEWISDLVAVFWPAFGLVWNGRIEKAGVALAAFFTCIAEYLYDDEELKKHVKEDQ